MNINRVGSMIIGALCSVATVGCVAEEGGNEPTVEASNGAPSVASKPVEVKADSVKHAIPATPATIAKLFSRMDSVGVGSQDRYNEAFKELRDSPTAIADLKSFYQSLPPTALGARWKAVYAAGQIPSAASIEFLEQVAGGSPEVSALSKAEAGGDIGFRMRYTAAVSVVQQYAAGIKGSDAAVERLVDSADPSIAQAVGLELFSVGRLTDAQRARLAKRGISSNFRQLTDSELTALRTVDPSEDGHRGADTRKRPRFTSVPPMTAAE